MKHTVQCLVGLTCVVSLIFSISSCGNGGRERTPPPVSSTTQTVVSGTVQAPGGQVAFFEKKNVLDFFVAEAYAALTGLANVPGSTIVQLARLNPIAPDFSVLATTTTSSGRYSFNLTALGLQPANNLIVRVAGSRGEEMRAFVVGTVADISPVSEAAYQLAVQSLNGDSIDNLTLQEVSDISGAVGLIGTLQNLGPATSIDQAVELVKTAVRNNAPVSGFLAAAAATGQTEEGAGDIGTFIPFEQGNIWRYKGTGRVSGAAVEYENTVTVSGQVSVPGHAVNGTIFSHTNAGGQGRAENYYQVKKLSGIMSYGTDDPRNNDTGQLVPFRTVHFPLTIGATILLGERNNVD